MRNILLVLFIIPLFSNAQILNMDIIQVKDGREIDYEAIEAFMVPIQQAAIKSGKKSGWYILKNIGGGDLSEIEDKGVVDYMILSTYKDLDQMKADTWDGYLEIAKRYLKNHQNNPHIYNNVKKNFINQNLVKPLHLCYHGVDLNRFKPSLIFSRLKKYNKLDKEKLFH